LADDEGEFQVLEMPYELLTPCQRAFRPLGKIARFASSWKTESHKKNGDALQIVEDLGGQAQPFAKPVAAGIREGHTGFMNFSPRHLPGDQNTRAGM
jgi:hypothetical protein